MAKIAFIGLGVMGGPMAANLVKAGHEVTATDLSIGAIDRAEAAGCKRGKTVAASVCDADFVLTMLPAGEHVRSVYLEPYGIVAHAKKGALLIDCSTIDVASARAVSAAAVTEGLEMADAPVSGDANAAKDGVLTFTVGGDASAFARAQPILRAMGATVVHAGAAGSGQAAMSVKPEAR